MTEKEKLHLFCPHCEAETDCEIIKQPTTINFRNKDYHVEEEFVCCDECTNEFDMFGLLDPLKQVYDEYRREHKYPTDEEIRVTRHRMDMTQEEFAKFLGTTESTIGFYERGAMPHDDHLPKLKELVLRYLGPRS